MVTSVEHGTNACDTSVAYPQANLDVETSYLHSVPTPLRTSGKTAARLSDQPTTYPLLPQTFKLLKSIQMVSFALVSTLLPMLAPI